MKLFLTLFVIFMLIKRVAKLVACIYTICSSDEFVTTTGKPRRVFIISVAEHVVVGIFEVLLLLYIA